MSPDPKQIPLEPEIDLVVGFVNTIDIEDDEDALRERADAAAWLETDAIDAGEHEHLIAFREALRALLRANNGGAASDEETAAIREAAGRSRYGAEFDPGGRLALAPLGDSPVERFEARLLLAIGRIQDGGEWARLKACPAGDCQWAFHDTSRNRSRTWCSMSVCGNRAKTRSYRARR